jgi:nicotinic acid mononucleotide adenylyltransferase
MSMAQCLQEDDDAFTLSQSMGTQTEIFQLKKNRSPYLAKITALLEMNAHEGFCFESACKYSKKIVTKVVVPPRKYRHKAGKIDHTQFPWANFLPLPHIMDFSLVPFCCPIENVMTCKFVQPPGGVGRHEYRYTVREVRIVKARYPRNRNNVIFSFQGSFGPPTYGHLMSMLNFATQIKKDYGGTKTLLFMPASGGSSKPHLYPTRSARVDVLRIFCRSLKSYFPDDDDIEFRVSEVEFNIAGEADRSVSTIHTIRKLVAMKKCESDEICLGMGLDNAYQLPYWESIDEYASLVSKIYVVHREPSESELENIRLFEVINADKTTTQMYFDVRIPSWTKAPFAKIFNREVDVPAICKVKSKHEIPPTSSTLVRYFIGESLVESESDGKSESGSKSQSNRQKIKQLMFGREISGVDYAVDETIESYKGLYVKPMECESSTMRLFSAIMNLPFFF